MAMKILVFTTLYPNAVQSTHGIFVESRLRQLLATRPVQARVVAPVPWFPSGHPRFGRYGAFAHIPRAEERHGIRVLHPRYPVIPKLGMSLAPYLLAMASRGVLRRLRAEGFGFDLIDAHYFYPDGVAAALLGRTLGRPVVITARGSDLNVIPNHRLPRCQIRRAARRVDAIVTVCEALRRRVLELGISAPETLTLRNGVDLERFSPQDRAPLRGRLGLVRPTLLSVGRLISSKGHDIAIRALTLIPDVDLVIVGSGPEAGALHALARSQGVEARVRFAGALAQGALCDWYCAADALVLASESEGWANVLLEAMACGTPVVASAVGGTPEVVASPAAGRLVAERRPRAFAEAVKELFASPPGRAATRRYAEGFGWEPTSEGQWSLFCRVLERRAERVTTDPSLPGDARRHPVE